MSNIAEFPDLSRARAEAADWISRASCGLDAAERAEFRRWRASPANARALQQLSALWTDMDVLRELSSVFPDPPGPSVTRRPARVFRPAMAAAVLLAMVGTGLAMRQYMLRSPAPIAAAQPAATGFTTAIGERRDVPLPDGSTLAINTGSEVKVVSLGRDSRELRLVRGEAHFTVAHDASRPFRVSAGGHVVQAVGTAFDVQLIEGKGLEVIVTDGRVKLLAGNGTAGDLQRGQFMRIAADGTARTGNLSDEAMASRMAWRTGMLVFDGQTLREVLAQFSRYTTTRMVITDPRLQELRIGGYFAAGDIDALREALQANFGIETRRGADGALLIGPEPGAAARQ